MAKLKAVSANCPSCGAALPVAPGLSQIQCRYCQNVITIEMRPPPFEVRPFGSPGVMPSQTLYVDPKAMADAQKGAQAMTLVILAVTLLPVLIGLGASFGGGCVRLAKPYPVSCGYRDNIEISGKDWNGPGPLVTKLGNNCRLRIKNAKIKGSSFVVNAEVNSELTLENVTVETTDTAFTFDSNAKVHLINSTLVSQGAVIVTDSNLVLDATGSTIESKTATAIKTKPNAKLQITNSKIRGKKSAFEAESNFELTLSKGTEISGADAVAIKTTSNMKLTSDGAKISGNAGAIYATSGLHLDLTDTTVTTTAEEAVEADTGLDIKLANSTIQGAVGVLCKSGLLVKATKKARIVGLVGNGITTTSGANISLNDSAIEGGAIALKAESGARLKLGANSRIAGKRGGIYSDSSLSVDGDHTAIEGGAGPGLRSTYAGTIAIHDSLIRGTPGTQVDRSGQAMDLLNTKVEGGQVVSK